ncbi:hypothetical protein O181_001620 [Austropuccinia psidii MF-1]|uniref:Uncharacterized protein n=1 Tax=Austropuccinia psidii MF-1 TaxID=1389203 RepID=A0A9Q3GC05_9BASI|nr:hypothetical protein [Austropuccinia psidii MF-1]
MFCYTFLISEVWFQELEIGVKELSSIISGRDCHPEFWINWPPILQDLIDITLELDTRYHERKKEKSHRQEKKPESSKSNYSNPKNSPSSNQKKKNFQKRDKPNYSLLNKDLKLISSENERRIKEGLFANCGGKHSIEYCFKRAQNQLSQPSRKFPSQGKA